MTKPSPFVCLSIFTFSIMLSGCELAPNTAEEAKITPVQPAHWIDNQLSKQQINSGKTAFLLLYDGFMSIAARMHLFKISKYHLDLQYNIWKNVYIGNIILS